MTAMTIYPTPNENGRFTLTDAAGNEVQEGYEYPTREAALEAAAMLWPSNSVWKGRRVRNGWRIEADDVDTEPRRKRRPGVRPDTSLYLGEDRRAWLQQQGGIQPTIQQLIDREMQQR
jgi:hypothetical protein